MHVLSFLPATHALVARGDKTRLTWCVELGKDEDVPINHNPYRALCNSAQLPFTPPPRNEEMRRGKRAAYAKVPDKQQLAHNKSWIKYLLSMT